MEPVRAGAPIVRGLHVENWAGVYATLGDAAPGVTDAASLAAAWAADLADPPAARARAERAAARLGAETAALASAADRLAALLAAA